MAEMSLRFNFDDFDEQICEALEQNDNATADIIPIRRPGAVGSVAVRFSQREQLDDLPPDVA